MIKEFNYMCLKVRARGRGNSPAIGTGIEMQHSCLLGLVLEAEADAKEAFVKTVWSLNVQSARGRGGRRGEAHLERWVV